MNDAPKLFLSPHYDNPGDFASILGLSTYAVEWGCRFSYRTVVPTHMARNFAEAVQQKATKFYTDQTLEGRFEAHFIDGENKLVIDVYKGYNEYICALFSNVGINHIFDFINDHNQFFTGAEGEIQISYLTRDGGQIEDRSLYISRDKLGPVYPELYPDIDIKKLLKAYLFSQDAILMLYGGIGVGKTSFVKFLLATGDFENIAYVKDPDVMNMGSLWSKLTSRGYDLVIFDDLDSGLAPRSKISKNQTFMTQLLSFSDGIFNSSKTKIVITTNQHLTEIDGALVRPGRCFDFIQLSPLTHAQALEAWTNTLGLDKERFIQIFKNDQQITQAALMGEATMWHSSINRDYIKSDDKDYTLDQKLAKLGIKAVVGKGDDAGFGFKRK